MCLTRGLSVLTILPALRGKIRRKGGYFASFAVWKLKVLDGEWRKTLAHGLNLIGNRLGSAIQPRLARRVACQLRRMSWTTTRVASPSTNCLGTRHVGVDGPF